MKNCHEKKMNCHEKKKNGLSELLLLEIATPRTPKKQHIQKLKYTNV